MLQRIKSIRGNILNSPNKTAIFLLIFWTFASRALGLVREALVGTMPPIEANIFGMAATLNENIVTTFILGSVSVAVLPQILKLESKYKGEEGKIKVNQFVSWVMVILSCSIALLCLIGAIFSRQFLQWLNQDTFLRVQEAGLEDSYIRLNQIFLLAPVIFAWKTVLGIFLNAKKSFKIYSIDGVLTNLGLIAGLSLLYSLFGLEGAGWGLILGFSIATSGFIFDAFRLGFRFNLGWFEGLNVILWQSFKLFVPRMFLLTAPRVAEMLMATVNRSEDGLALFRMSINIQGIFYGLMLSVSTVFLPDLTQILFKQGANSHFWKHLNKYLKNSVVFGLIATIFTIFGAPVILFFISLPSMQDSNSLLGNWDNLWQIVILTAIGSLAIVFQAVGEILSKYFIALEDNKFSILASFVANILSVLFALILVQYINPVIAVTVSFVFNNILLTAILSCRARIDYLRTNTSNKVG